MEKVTFDQTIKDQNITFVVIVCNYQGKWLFCKHKDRQTYESPGGRREKGETIKQTAHRELFEESGATEYTLQLISPYRLKVGEVDFSYGMLCYADIKKLSPIPESEIESIRLFDEMPEKLTYPDVQHDLMDRVMKELSLKRN